MDTVDRRRIFETAIQPHLSDGFGLARCLARNRADAEDILQDASIRALRAVDQIRDGSPRAWFMAIVRNTAYTWLARHQRLTLEAMDDDAFDVPSAPETWAAPEAALIAQADAAALQTAVRALPESFREVVILRDIQGFNYREIAEITGAPLGTVMSRLARARRKLVSELRSIAPDTPRAAERCPS